MTIEADIGHIITGTELQTRVRACPDHSDAVLVEITFGRLRFPPETLATRCANRSRGRWRTDQPQSGTVEREQRASGQLQQAPADQAGRQAQEDSRDQGGGFRREVAALK